MADLWTSADDEVPLRSFPADFRALIADLESAYKLGHRSAVAVTLRVYDDFLAWAEQEKPDWDRYAWDGTKALVEQGRLPRSAMRDYDNPDLAQAKATRDEWRRLGFDRYVDQIALSLAAGNSVPPLVAVRGRPVDGRHRALAAARLGLAEAPVVDLWPVGQAGARKTARQLDAEIARTLSRR